MKIYDSSPRDHGGIGGIGIGTRDVSKQLRWQTPRAPPILSFPPPAETPTELLKRSRLASNYTYLWKLDGDVDLL